MITLLNVDCMEYMAKQQDKSFDLAIVDPPYGINGDYHRRNVSRTKLAKPKKYHNAIWDQQIPENKYFRELERISGNQIIWGANNFMHLICKESPCWIVWDKQNNDSTFADCELAYTSFKTAVRKYSFTWNGMLQGNMKQKETRIHPTQKPVSLYTWLLTNYAKKGHRILDTHLGSGSSAIAAHYFGVEFVGCEIDKTYFDDAKKRFDAETRQISLF